MTKGAKKASAAFLTYTQGGLLRIGAGKGWVDKE